MTVSQFPNIFSRMSILILITQTFVTYVVMFLNLIPDTHQFAIVARSVTTGMFVLFYVTPDLDKPNLFRWKFS